MSLAALCWAGFAAIAYLVEGGRTAAFDRAGMLLFRRSGDLQPLGPDWLTGAIHAVTTLGDGIVRHPVSIAGAVFLLVRKLRHEALWLVLTIFPAAELSNLIKNLIARPRPMLVPYRDNFLGYSFPSSHSFNSPVVWIALAIVLVPLLRPGRSPRNWVIAATLLSLGIAFSRVWLGVHWPSDAIAGWLGGVGWLLIALTLRPRRAAEPQSTVQV